MNFERLKYLDWARKSGIERVAYPLFSSELKSLRINELVKLGLKLKNIETAGTPEDTYGMVNLKETIARHYKVKHANVTLTTGVSMAMFIALSSLLNRGNEIIIEHPCYEPILKGAQVTGAKIKRLHRKFSNQFQPDISELKKLLTPHTKAIYLTNLHNPSGVQIKPELLREIGRLASRTNTYVITNEIYLDYLLDKIPAPSFTMSDNFITMSSLTKVYGLGWVRAGWILADKKITKQFHYTLDYLAGHNSYPSLGIAMFAFKKLNQLRKYARDIISTNLPIMKEWMASQESIQWIEPASGIICFPKLPSGINSMKFVNYLKKRYNTLVVPGEFFESPGHVRIGLGCPTDTLRKGLNNINQAIKTY